MYHCITLYFTRIFHNIMCITCATEEKVGSVRETEWERARRIIGGNEVLDDSKWPWLVSLGVGYLSPLFLDLTAFESSMNR